MMKRTRRWTWDTFAASVRPIIDAWRATHHHTPTTLELRTSGQVWILSTAYRQFGGYRTILTKLGYPPPSNRTKYGHIDGLFRWDTFRQRAEPFLRGFFEEFHRSPTSNEVKARRGQWLLSAAHHYHGGYIAVLTKLGLPKPLRWQQRRPKRVKVRNWSKRIRTGARPGGYWTIPQHRMDAMRRHFATQLERQIMPTAAMVLHVVSGLATYWLRRPGGWPAACRECGCLTPEEGKRVIARLAVLDWLLTFYEHHHRWPHRGEATGPIRYWRWTKKNSWLQLTMPRDVHRPFLSQVIARWTRHHQWIVRHEPNRAMSTRIYLNELIVQRNSTLSITRPR